ncbi:MAG: hypothetical protein LKF64_00230 [Alcaligenes faecalis]|jgi:hypothetical protein|nr:hypothetical protein [Alcaligenes faecalis]
MINTPKTDGNNVKTDTRPENVNDYQTYAETRQELFDIQAHSPAKNRRVINAKAEKSRSQNLMVSPDCDQIVSVNEHGFTEGTRYNGQIFAY